MLILIYGNDTYRSKQRLHQLRDAFRLKYDKSGINTVQLDAESMKPEQFNQQFSAQGFLTEKRFLSVSNILTKGSAASHQAILSALESVEFATDNIVVFWEGDDITDGQGKRSKSEARATLQAGLLQNAKKERFVSLTPDEVQTWIVREVQRRGGTIETNAAAQLAAAVGDDLWTATNEIDKLIHYVDGHAISETDINQMVVSSADDSLFVLTDALGQGNTARALTLLEERMQAGADPIALLRAVTWHIRTLVAVKSFLDDRGGPPAIIARELQLHPFVAQKVSQQAAGFSLQQLQYAYQQLLAIDEQLKTSRVNPLALLDLFALSLDRNRP